MAASPCHQLRWRPSTRQQQVRHHHRSSAQLRPYLCMQLQRLCSSSSLLPSPGQGRHELRAAASSAPAAPLPQQQQQPSALQQQPLHRQHQHQGRRCVGVAASASASSSSGGGQGAAPGSLLSPALLKALDQQIVPILLISGFAAAAAAPSIGLAASNAGLPRWITIFIFVLAGLQLKQGEAMQALKASGCVAWGLVSILLLSPLISLLLPWLPLPAAAKPMALGTAVFCAMPTTLSSGISLTATAGGNTALAILLTVASNMLGVVTLSLSLPLVVSAATAAGIMGTATAAGTGSAAAAAAALSPLLLLRQLVESVLMPTMAGALARAYVPGMDRLVDGNRRAVLWLSGMCLASVPWMQVSKAIAAGLNVPPTYLALAFALGAGVHLLFLVFNSTAVVALNLGGPRPLLRAQLRQALVLQASQKTLPVAVAVLSEGLSAQLGPTATGLAAMSAVAAHLAQVLIDSFLVGSMARYIERAAVEEAALKAS